MSETDTLVKSISQKLPIGNSSKGWSVKDYDSHVNEFKEGVPFLADFLDDSDLKGIAEIYSRADAAAIEKQNAFMKTMNWANAAVFSTAVCGALLLSAVGLQQTFGSAGSLVVKIIALGGIFSSGLAAMLLVLVKQKNLLKKWTEERSKAEEKRVEFFKTMVNQISDKPEEQLPVFEYVNRYLLDDQMNYFKKRGTEHARAGNTAANLSAGSTFVYTICTLGAGGIVFGSDKFAVLAALGVIAASFGKLVASKSAVNQDNEIAMRYNKMLYQLQELKRKSSRCQRNIASGDTTALQQFFEPVFILLEADHKIFINKESALRGEAIDAVNNELGNNQQQLKSQTSE